MKPTMPGVFFVRKFMFDLCNKSYSDVLIHQVLEFVLYKICGMYLEQATERKIWGRWEGDITRQAAITFTVKLLKNTYPV